MYLDENKSEIKPDHYNYVINTTHTDEKFEVIREEDGAGNNGYINNTRNGG
jgi:hypothetical protein